MALQDKLEDNGWELDDLKQTLQIDGFDDAAVGVTNNYEIVYDYDKLVDECCRQLECTVEEAIDYVEFNILGSLPPRYGTAQPVVMYLFEDENDKNKTEEISKA